MNILVSGSNGFIASYLIPELEALGHTVNGMDIKRNPFEDVRGYADCLARVGRNDVIVHLASKVDVQESIKNKLTYNDHNLKGTLNMLEASRGCGVKRFVYISSAAADNPTSPYGVTKLCGEIWCDLYNKCYGLSTISLRPFNVYGKGNGKGVIDIWVDNIKNGIKPIVYGGEQIRDFVYVKDVVGAIIKAIDSDSVGMCEVGTGVGTRIYELSHAVFNVMDVDFKVEMLEQKKNEIEESVARNLKNTKQMIGWKHEYSLEQGLEDMLK